MPKPKKLPRVTCPKCGRRGSLVKYPPTASGTSASIIHAEIRDRKGCAMVTDYCFIFKYESKARTA